MNWNLTHREFENDSQCRLIVDESVNCCSPGAEYTLFMAAAAEPQGD